MAKLLFVTSAFTGSLLLLLNCQNSDESPNKEQKKILILTSFYPMYLFTSNIVQNSNRIKVKSLIGQSFGDPHHYHLTPLNMKQIGTAKALIINHYSHETFIRPIQKIFPNLKIIESGSNIFIDQDSCSRKNNCNGKNIQHKRENIHHQKSINTHFWVSPCLALKQVTKIADDLSILDPYDEVLYQKNAKIFIASLQMLCNNIKTQFPHLTNKKAISYHGAFQYLFKDLGLNIIATIQAEEERTPTPKELYNLEKKLIALTEQVPIFVEDGHNDIGSLMAENLAQKTGNKVYKLNPITHGPNTLNSYEKIIAENLKIINYAFKISA